MSNNTTITRGSGTSVVREGVDGRSMEQRHETSSTAVAAAMQAQIQARYSVAIMRPRDDDNVRVRLLKRCEHPNFAKNAFYSIRRRGAKPGRLTGTPGMVEGLSVRFAEAAIQIAGNILQSTRITYDDDFKRMVNVAATDLETNAAYERDLILEKTVERRERKDNDTVLGERTNSYGDKVFIMQCTEEELLVKESALVSRMFRTEALRFVPADTLEECERQIIATVRDLDAKDPDAAKKEVADAFAALNVTPADLKIYLGHELGQCSPAEITNLRGLFAGIRDGAVSWAEVLAEKAAETGDGVKKTVAEKLAERQAAKAAGKGGAPPGSNEGAKAEAKTGTRPAAAENKPNAEPMAKGEAMASQGAQAAQGAPAAPPTPKGPKAEAKAAQAPAATPEPAKASAPAATAPGPDLKPDNCHLCGKKIDWERDGCPDKLPDGRKAYRHEACKPGRAAPAAAGGDDDELR